MAITKQVTPARTRVGVDFPELPKIPELTISEDNNRMQAYQAELELWHQSLKTVVLDKLNALQQQLDQLKV